MSCFFYCLVVISIATSVTGQVSSSSNKHLFTTVGEARYRITTARLTINDKTRQLVHQFAEAADWQLELGCPDASQEREIQDALTSLEQAASKWNHTAMAPSSQWNKMDGLVKHLSEVLKSWPGFLIDRFILDAIQDFNQTILKVQPDLEKLQSLNDELQQQWPKKGKLFEQWYELEKLLEPVVSAVEQFHGAMQQYMMGVKQLWHTDRVPDSTHQKRLTKALWNVQLRVTRHINSDRMSNSNEPCSFCCPLLYFSIIGLMVAICMIIHFWSQS